MIWALAVSVQIDHACHELAMHLLALGFNSQCSKILCVQEMGLCCADSVRILMSPAT